MTDFQISKESSLPLHVQLLDELRHKIMSGLLKPNEQLPGEWELVNSLNISRATIQRAWQSAQDEGLIYRITGKGTFVAEPISRYSGRNAIGFIIPEYRGTFAMSLLSGAERMLRKAGYAVQFASTDREISEENRLLQKLVEDDVCGVILVPVHSSFQERVLASKELSIPIVQMDRPMNGVALPCVTSNNYMGGLQAMNHLVDLGHRHILFVARPHLDLWPVAERYRAYQYSLRRIGIEPLEPLLVGGDTELSSYEAYLQQNDEEIAPLIERLQQANRPTAIFAVNDWIALRVYRAAELLGLHIPKDLSLVGFDDLDIAQYQKPPLTTVAQNANLMGAEAARRLLALIEGEEVSEILTLVPTRFVLRESTLSFA
ncbi:MAG: GntR family transcriptional regulator [Anaerolineae bacterium]|nr:GntR family transcriptional regulator [Anaerolineae bacterium]